MQPSFLLCPSSCILPPSSFFLHLSSFLLPHASFFLPPFSLLLHHSSVLIPCRGSMMLDEIWRVFVAGSRMDGGGRRLEECPSCCCPWPMSQHHNGPLFSSDAELLSHMLVTQNVSATPLLRRVWRHPAHSCLYHHGLRAC